MFWDHQFVYCAPEIKSLFDSVRENMNRSVAFVQKPLGQQDAVA
jgi:hypothetical protein